MSSPFAFWLFVAAISGAHALTPTPTATATPFGQSPAPSPVPPQFGVGLTLVSVNETSGATPCLVQSFSPRDFAHDAVVRRYAGRRLEICYTELLIIPVDCNATDPYAGLRNVLVNRGVPQNETQVFINSVKVVIPVSWGSRCFSR